MWLLLFACGCRPIEDVSLDAPAALDFSMSEDGGPPAGFVSAANGHLELDGRRFRFVGANRYDVASFPPGSGNFFCGNPYTDAQIDQLVSELASTGATLLRLWAFQSFTLGATDYSTIDRALAAARRHGLKVILVLENQWADCTQPDTAGVMGAKSATFYQSGYYTGPLGTYPFSLRDYARLIVARYKDEPAVAMWQLMNEAQCDDGAALLQFAGDLAHEVKSIDRYHLVSLGTIGSGQPGTAGGAYRALHSLDDIDVVEAHDYHDETTAMPPAILGDLRDAQSLAKPFFVGEAGIAAPAPMYPFTLAQRAAAMDAKIGAQWTAGGDGFLVWSFYDLKSDNAQGWDFNPADPLAAVLAKRAAEPLP